MAVNAKAVIGIDVDDKDWKEFEASYAKFLKMIGQSPKVLAGMSQQTRAIAESFTRGTAALMAQNAAAQKHAVEMGKHHKAHESLLREMVKHSKEMTKHSIEQVKHWKERAAVMIGLATGAEFFGIERLGQWVHRGQVSARGHGLGFGQQKALEHFADKYGLDAGAMASSAATASETPESAPGIWASIHGFQNKRGLDAVVAQMNTIRKLGREGNSPGQIAGMQGMSNFGYGEEQIRRIIAMSAEEYSKAVKELPGKAAGFDVSEKAQKAWVDFIGKLESFTDRIKVLLAEVLTPLLPVFEAAMKKFEAWAAAFLADPKTKKALQEFIDEFPVWAEKAWKSMKQFAVSAEEIIENLKIAGLISRSPEEKEAKAKRDADLVARGKAESERIKANPTYKQSGVPDAGVLLDMLGDYLFRKWSNTMTTKPIEPMPGGALDSHASGTMRVKKAGTYRLHGGEAVIPESKMDQWKASIGSIESSSPWANKGNYGTLGKVIPYGGGFDRAHGKYQVMGSNIADWTKKALGYSMTPQQFLADPGAQEKVFETIFGENAAKYGPVDAASIWFSGRRALANNSSDPLGTSVPGYLKQFVAGLSGQFAQNIATLNIMDNTGGNVAMSMTAMGQPGGTSAPSFPL